MINYSIIIPHYNIPELLRRCINSIPQREDVQVIVVDDNSPGSEKYCDTIPELSREDVEFYITYEKKGAGNARNIGLSHAVGKWLIFADSDDFFVDDFSQILDSYKDNPHDIIYFNIKSCDCYDTSNIIPSKKDRLFVEYSATGNELVFRVGGTEPWGKIIRRQLIVDNSILFQETRGHNDLLFSVVSGIRAKSIEVVNRPMYWYVYREGSTGHQNGIEPIEKIQDRILAWKSVQDFLKSESIATMMYLPAIPCIRVLKKSITMLPDLLQASRRIGCNNTLLMYSIVKYVMRRIIAGKKGGLCIDEQLSKTQALPKQQ